MSRRFGGVSAFLPFLSLGLLLSAACARTPKGTPTTAVEHWRAYCSAQVDSLPAVLGPGAAAIRLTGAEQRAVCHCGEGELIGPARRVFLDSMAEQNAYGPSKDSIEASTREAARRGIARRDFTMLLGSCVSRTLRAPSGDPSAAPIP